MRIASIHILPARAVLDTYLGVVYFYPSYFCKRTEQGFSPDLCVETQ